MHAWEVASMAQSTREATGNLTKSQSLGGLSHGQKFFEFGHAALAFGQKAEDQETAFMPQRLQHIGCASGVAQHIPVEVQKF